MSIFDDLMEARWPSKPVPRARREKVVISNIKAWLAEARKRRLSISAVHMREWVEYTATDRSGHRVGAHKTAYVTMLPVMSRGWFEVT